MPEQVLKSPPKKLN